MAGTVGRPKCWDSPEELQAQIDTYFNHCDNKEKPYTIAGLAVFLEVDRQTIYNYEKKQQFFDTIKKARDRIYNFLEEWCIMKGNAGTIFVMKNYGYTDKQEVQYSEQPIPSIIVDDSEE
ncbi:MAG: terminase small subunit [Thiomicrorhabdus sp.]|jgi:hypothetical protein|nr:terminase small subunit [Thiomicrorhabdus sp.]